MTVLIHVHTNGVSEAKEGLRPRHDRGHFVGPDADQDAQDRAERGSVGDAIEES